MRLQVHEILDKVIKLRTKQERIDLLKEHSRNWALRDIIRGSMDPSIKFNLPDGKPPYEACEAHNAPSDLMKRHLDFRHFISGGPGDKLPAVKREKIFLGILESIHPKDAELVVSMINKNLEGNISKTTIDEAFPGLITG